MEKAVMQRVGGTCPGWPPSNPAYWNFLLGRGWWVRSHRDFTASWAELANSDFAGKSCAEQDDHKVLMLEFLEAEFEGWHQGPIHADVSSNNPEP